MLALAPGNPRKPRDTVHQAPVDSTLHGEDRKMDVKNQNGTKYRIQIFSNFFSLSQHTRNLFRIYIPIVKREVIRGM